MRSWNNTIFTPTKTLNPVMEQYLASAKIWLHDELSPSYSFQEYIDLRWDIPWALYVVEHVPEILEHRDLLENIRATRSVAQMNLSGKGWEWYVLQISDICIKCKNKNNPGNFLTEIENYKQIEHIYSIYMNNQNLFAIPELQYSLSDERVIAMEYIPGLTLFHNFVLQDKKITSEIIWKYLEQYNQFPQLSHIAKRLWYNYVDCIYRLQDYELEQILLLFGISESYRKVIASQRYRDSMIEQVLGKDYLDVYTLWKDLLQDHGIDHIDDHSENLKIYNNKLYGLDFGYVTFNLSKSWSVLNQHR